MAVSRIVDNIEFAGTATFTGAMNLPASTVTDAAVAAGANVAENKLQHRVHAKHVQASGADVASQTALVHTAYKAATLLGANVHLDTAPTGGDKAFTVDVKKSTAGGAWATILSSVLTINNAKTSRTQYPATLSGTPTLIAGDALQVVIAASGSTGSQGQGVLVDVLLAENGA